MTDRPIALTLLWRFHVGGAEKLIVELLRHQRDHGGYAPHLAVFEQDGPLRAELEALGVPMHTLSAAGLPATLLGFARLVRRLRPAVMHAHGIGPGFYGAVASRLAGVPLVTTRHGQGVGDGPAWQLRLSVRWTARFVGVSDDVSRLLRERLGVPAERVSTVLNGVPVERFAGGREVGLRRELGLAEATFLMGSVARLDPVKQQDRMLELTRVLLDDGRDVALVIAGDGPERPALERRLTELDLAGRAWLLGPRDDIPALLRNLDLFLLTSRSEGIPVSMLEAMAAGAPCVMTRVGGIGEVCADGRHALLVPDGDAAALVAATGRLIDEPALGGHLTAHARALVVERYSTSRMATDYERLYDAARR